MLTLLAKLLAALNSESSPRQLALAIAMGMLIGLTPMINIHNVLILLLAFVLRVNLGAFFLSVAVFSGFGLFTATPFAGLGETLLNNPNLESLWTGMYQVTLFKLFHFHHTLTLGSLIAALILFVPLIVVSQYLIVRYRVHLRAFVEKFKIIRTLKSSRFFQMYQTFSSKGV